MTWLKCILVLLVLALGGSWLYHGWIVPPVKSPADDTRNAAAVAKNTYDLTRIVATDGALTEIVYALGFGDRVVAADSSAQWPPSVMKKPSIGYVRRLSSEGVLSLKPTLILNNIEAGPPEAIEQLRKSGIPVVDIPGEKQDRSFATVVGRIHAIAATLGVPEKGRAFVTALEADLAAVRGVIGAREGPKGLFVFNPTVEKLTCGGAGTGAHEFFELLRMRNVAAGLEGWKPLSQEAVIGAAPDVIVTTARSHQTFATAEELLAIHGLGQTPAGKAKRVIYVDGGKFLSGGPCAGEMALEFAAKIYPDLRFPESQSKTWLRDVEGRHP